MRIWITNLHGVPHQPTRADRRSLRGDPALGGRAGKFSSAIAGGFAIPLALGDYLGEFRLVGTTPEFFEKLKHGPDVDQPFTFREGRALQSLSTQYGFYEAVLGSRVAKAEGLNVGDLFSPVHGDPDGVGHDQKFTVVGVLDPTGTPNDSAAFVNLEGFYLMDKHAQPVSDEEQAAMAQPTVTYEGTRRYQFRHVKSLQFLCVPEACCSVQHCPTSSTNPSKLARRHPLARSTS